MLKLHFSCKYFIQSFRVPLLMELQHWLLSLKQQPSKRKTKLCLFIFNDLKMGNSYRVYMCTDHILKNSITHYTLTHWDQCSAWNVDDRTDGPGEQHVQEQRSCEWSCASKLYFSSQSLMIQTFLLLPRTFHFL